MKYITGVHALNLPCKLSTCGDWHQSAIQWDAPQIRNTEESFFGEYGIEKGHNIPEHGDEQFAVANTIRACLDLLVEGNFPVAQGMKDDYICNDAYDIEVFSMVYLMRVLNNWEKINSFMKREYKLRWIKFLEEKHDE